MIEIQGLAVTNGTFELQNINLTVQSEQYAVLTGPTGSGKSTLLETICGLKRQSSGKILLDNQPIHNLPPAQRQIGFGIVRATRTERLTYSNASWFIRW